jgi:hypothetical protein
MIVSVIPLRATARRGEVELGVTWLLLGEDWMILDYATRGIGSYSHVGLADDGGRSYTSMGGGASGDHTGLLRHHTYFREALDPQATGLRLTLAEAKENGQQILETTVPIGKRVPETAVRAKVASDSMLSVSAPDRCRECGRPGAQWLCTNCRAEAFVIAEHRSRRLVPETIVPIPGNFDLVGGLRHAVAGILLWESTFMVRFVFEPAPRRSRRQLPDLPRPIVGRWTGEDAVGHTFVGRPNTRGLCESEGKVLGDATIEFMPTLDPSAGPLRLRTESAGRMVAELELPLDGPTQIVGAS